MLYATVFIVTGAPAGDGLRNAAANVLPLAGLAAATHALIKDRVMPLSVPWQAGAHAFGAPAFALCWYALLLMTLAIFAMLAGYPFRITPFSGPAFSWQVFQGLLLYALVAAVTYALRGGRQAAALTIVNTPERAAPLDRYLVRDGDYVTPIAVDDIILITGAQDYSEVTTASGKHLVRLSLGEFEARLDPKSFLRVHRSSIINFARLDRAEPAGGGRMLAWMENGESVPVSRAGAQLLRSFVV